MTPPKPLGNIFVILHSRHCPPGNPPPFKRLDGDEDDKDKRRHGDD